MKLTAAQLETLRLITKSELAMGRVTDVPKGMVNFTEAQSLVLLGLAGVRFDDNNRVTVVATDAGHKYLSESFS